jgi:serine/threonine protein kinase
VNHSHDKTAKDSMSNSNASHNVNPRPEPDATNVYQSAGSASELVRILDQYLVDLQSGQAPDKAKLIQEHPDLALELENCLAGIEFVHGAARPAAAAPTELGDFRLLREVGRGGMGVVYEAEQISLKRKVALKVLRFGVSPDADVAKRFQREAETVAHLHHTNIVPIHAVGCENGVHYYAMQFIEGRSLAAVLCDFERTASGNVEGTDFRQVAGWILQSAEALAHAHQRGVIHRDIKPSNLILDPEGTVWLTDFGLAKRADEITMTAAGVMLGTPRYMSPEQAAAARQPVDHRTDIYSLGATFYELATGKPVFDSQTPHGVITQILNAEPVSPRSLQGKLPRDLETVILKCLAKEPSRRYQRARDLTDDLRAYLENRPIRARRASLYERAKRWGKKHQRSTVVSAVTAVISLLLIAFSLGSWHAYQNSKLGRLMLSTDGPTLVAEVLNDEDELIVPSFPVPNPQPVALPAGSYRVRLSGAGALSETWQMDVEKGITRSYAVSLLDRSLGTPLEIRGTEAPVQIQLDGQMHLFHRGERGWRLTKGDTLGPVWQDDLSKFPENPDSAPYPNSGYIGAHQDILQVSNNATSQMTGTSPGLSQPAVDLNQDSRDDLILASRVSPSLVAVSGTDGKVLWWYRALPVVPKEHDLVQDPLDMKASFEDAGVVGQPLTVAINGEPAVIGVFVSFNSRLQTKSGKEFHDGRTFHVDAVAARTGKQLWRQMLNVPDLPSKYVGEFVNHFSERPVLSRLNGKEGMILVAGTKVFRFELRTGAEIGPALDLKSAPVQTPHFADLDGDFQADGLFVMPKPGSRTELTLQAVSLNTGAELWTRDFYPADRLESPERGPADSKFASLVDLDGDQNSEVLLALADEWTNPALKHWYGVEVLEGKTGQTRWQRRLWASTYTGHSSSGGANGAVRILAGPDLNGDHHRELFVTSMGEFQSRGNDSLHVDALSGEDGVPVWRRQLSAGQSLVERKSRMQWWQAGHDGWPQLVVPIEKVGSTQSVTYLFSASTGRISHLLPEVSNSTVSDMNSDGILDLSYLATSQGNRHFTVLKGLPCVEWQSPGEWQAAADYDADGMTDFLKFQVPNASSEWEPSYLEARSGRDQRTLWRSNIQRTVTTPATLVDVDVDDDGVSDVVTIAWYPAPDGNKYASCAVSGKNGKRLWSGTEIGTNIGSESCSGGGAWCNYSYPFLDAIDLDGDGRKEILVACTFENQGLCLAANSSLDGSQLWRIPILPGAYTGQSMVDRNLFHDLNGDRVLDLVLWGPETLDAKGNRSGAKLRAYSGRDGQSLWPALPQGQLDYGYFLWPRTAIGDLDGDGHPEVVLTTNDGKGYDSRVGGVNCELAVLDGRSGQRKWNWRWISESLVLWPPLLVDMDGNGRRTVCMGVQGKAIGKTVSEIVMFDSQGQIRNRLAAGWINLADAWTALDVDSDGKEELLYAKDSQVCAQSGIDHQVRWKRPISSWSFRFDRYRAGQAGLPGTLVVWSDRTCYGLNPRSGATQWRCDVARQDNAQLIAEFYYPNESSVLPAVKSVGATLRSTVVQSACPTNAEGTYSAPQTEPSDFATVTTSVRYRALPWNRNPRPALRVGGPPSSSWKSPLRFSELPLFLASVCTLLYWAFNGRWRAVLIYLGAIILTTSITAFLMLAGHPALEVGEHYLWDGWYWVIYLGMIPVGFFTVLMFAVLWGVSFIKQRIGKK